MLIIYARGKRHRNNHYDYWIVKPVAIIASIMEIGISTFMHNKAISQFVEVRQ